MSTIFVKSPMYDNWFKSHVPKKSLLICSPYVKKDALDRIIELIFLKDNNANVDIKLLLRGANKEFIEDKSSDISVLTSFKENPFLKGSNVRRITNLHMKAYLVDDTQLLITSGNLTDSGIFVKSGCENFEGGIATDDPELINNFKAYFTFIWNQADKLDDFYDLLLTEYKNHIKNLGKDYSDTYVKKHVRRKKFKFDTKTVFPKDKAEKVDSTSYDIMPVGSVEHIDYILQRLDSTGDLSYLALGDLLRKKFETIPKNESDSNKKTNDRKYGEEKGKFSVYFDLVSIHKQGRQNMFHITDTGKWFLQLDQQSKDNYIKDKLFAKPDFCMMLNAIDGSDSFNMMDFLSKQYPNRKRSTLSRNAGAIVSLLEYLKKKDIGTELKSILDKIK